MTALLDIDLNSLLIFDAVAEAGSFTGAADRLGVAKAKVSLQISRLEARLGVTLFNRTTRQVTLSDAGRSLHMECRPLLQRMQEALDQIGQDSDATPRLTGTLRVCTTVDHAVQTLAPALAKFASLHPELQIELRTGDRVVDLVSEGVDLAIRLGWLRDSTLRAVKLGEFEQHVVSSPAYLHRAGLPKRPEQLAQHEWIALSLMPTPLTWKFTSRRNALQTVQVKSRIRVDSPGALRAMLRHGSGISVLDQFSAEEAVRAGYLVRILGDWSLPRAGIYAVYPPGRHVPAKVRAFIAFYRDWLQGPSQA